MPLSAFAAVAVALALGSLPLATDGHHSQNVTIRTPDDRSPRTCADVVVTFDDQPAATAEDHLRVPRPAGALNLRAPSSGGIFVVGTSRADFAVTVCKAVAPSGDTNAALASIRPSAAAGTVSVSGGDADRWIAYLLVEAPREAAIDLEALNGPLEVRDVAGLYCGPDDEWADQSCQRLGHRDGPRAERPRQVRRQHGRRRSRDAERADWRPARRRTLDDGQPDGARAERPRESGSAAELRVGRARRIVEPRALEVSGYRVRVGEALVGRRLALD